MLIMSVYRQTVLGSAFGFTEDDLEENRQGRLSVDQVARLRRRAGMTSVIVIGILGVLGVLSVLSAGPDPSGMPIFLFCLGMPALFTLAFTVVATEVAVSPRVVAKRSGVVHLAYGMFDYVPKLDYQQGRSARGLLFGRLGAYTMIVSEQEFQLSQTQWELLKPGAYAAIYYLPTIHKIVSLELIDSDIQAEEPPTIDVVAEPIPVHTDNSDTGDVIRA